ncbi:MAG: four-helix bundle copper-binding protein [Rhodothermales bacterium]
MVTQQILSAHPSPASHLDALVACIEDCFECEQACTACADACLAEEKLDMLRRCIRTDLDCADICATTGRVLSRQTEPTWGLIRDQVTSLRTACRTCAEECEKHKDKHEHCRICAEACRRCEQSCDRLLDALPKATA